MVNSRIAGSKVRQFNGNAVDITTRYYNNAIGKTKVIMPDYYIIPREWKIIVDRLKLHGVNVDVIDEEDEYLVEKYKFSDVSFPKMPYEGRFSPSYKYSIVKDTVTAHSGDYIINTSQRTAGLITHLLEPDAPDSFIKWGFFNIIFERKEYFEDYALIPIAEKMLKQDSNLKMEFEAMLRSDTAFANSPRARMNFFYERTPYYDSHYNVYPVLRVIEEL